MPTSNDLYIPAMRTRDVVWDGEDADGLPMFRAKVRSDLTFAEVDALQWNKESQTSAVHTLFAPYVLEWNAGRLNDAGEPEPIPAPAVGGGEMFQAVPNEFFWWLARDIKFHSSRALDPKPLTAPAPTVAPSNDPVTTSVE